MGAKVIAASDIADLVARWAGSRRVLTPGPPPEYGEWMQWDGGPISLPPVNAVLSPKGAVFRRSEALFSYRTGEGDVTLDQPGYGQPAVLFGVRPCDARGLGLLDSVFLEDGSVPDPAYADRRNQTIVVTVACDAPGPGCFCTSVGGDPHGREGADLACVSLDERWLLIPVTERGEALLAEAPDLEDAAAGDTDRAEHQAQLARDSVPSGFTLDGICERLDSMFDDGLWDRIHEPCIGCGTCTWLCPTCHCFDVTDERRGDGYTRFRTWDSCQFPLFTLHASGHNPRPTGKERLRQRLLHKFNYYPHRYGPTACVGCGRCVISCPVNIDIRQLMREIGGSGQ